MDAPKRIWINYAAANKVDLAYDEPPVTQWDDVSQPYVHIDLMAELVEALRITREKLLSIAHSEFDGVWSDQDFLNEVAEADAALAKIKEPT